VRAQTGVSSPVAATSRDERANARVMASQASASSSVSASTVMNVSLRSSTSAALSAHALPPCGSRSQRSVG